MNERELVFALKFVNRTNSGLGAFKQAATQAAAAVKGVDAATRNASARLTAFQRVSRSVGTSITNFSSTSRAAFSRLRTSAIRLQSALIAIGLGVGIVNAVRTLRDFEFQMARLRAIAGDGNEALDKLDLRFRALEATARRLGETTQFTASEVADGLRLLTQAGFSANEAISAIPGTLNLAIAASTDLGTATTITANTIRGFNLAASEATRVADVLTATTQKTNTTIELLGEALKFAAPAAAAANQTLETTAAALGVLADAGLKGTLAGTGLRRVLVGLLNPTKEAEKAFKGLGLDIAQLTPGARKADGSLRQLTDIISDLAKSTFGARAAFASFGLRGGPAALVLVQAERLNERFSELTKTVTQSEGRAASFAATINDTLRGALIRLNSKYQELILSQTGLGASLRNVVNFLNDVLDALNGTLSPLDKTKDSAREFAGILREVGEAAKFVVDNFKALVIGYVALKGVIAGVTLATKTFQFALFSLNTALISTGVGALVVGLGLLAAAYFKVKGAAAQAKAEQDAFNASLGNGVRLLDEISVENLTDEQKRAAVPLIDAQLARFELDLQSKKDQLAQAEKDLADAQEKARRASPGKQGSFARQDLITAEALVRSRRAEVSATQATTIALKARRDEFQKSIDDLDLFGNLSKQNLETENALGEEFGRLAGSALADVNKAFEEINRKAEIARLEAEGTVEALAKVEEIKIRAEIEAVPEQVIAGLRNFANEQSRTAQKSREAAAELEAQGRVIESGFLIEAAKQSERYARDANAEADAIAATTEAIVKKALATAEAKRLTEELNRTERAQRQLQNFRQEQISKLELEAELRKLNTDQAEKFKLVQELVNETINKGQPIREEWINQLLEAYDRTREVTDATNTMAQGFSDAFEKIIEDGLNFRAQGEELIGGLFKSLEDQLVNFVETGKFSFAELGNFIRQTLVRQAIQNVLAGGLKGLKDKFFGGGTEKAQENQQVVAAVLKATENQTERLINDRQSTTGRDALVITEKLNALQITMERLGTIAGGQGSTAADVAAGAGNIVGSAQGAADSGFNLGTITSLGSSLLTGARFIGSLFGFSFASGTSNTSNALKQMQNLRKQGLGGLIGGGVGGGLRAAGLRAAGLDSGEIPAILHPNEAVIPLNPDGTLPLSPGPGGNLQVNLPSGEVVRAASGGANAERVGRAARKALGGEFSLRGAQNAIQGAKGVAPGVFRFAPRADFGISAIITAIVISIVTSIATAAAAAAAAVGAILAGIAGFIGIGAGVGGAAAAGGALGAGAIGLTGSGLIGALTAGSLGGAVSALAGGVGSLVGIGAGGLTGAGILGAAGAVGSGLTGIAGALLGVGTGVGTGAGVTGATIGLGGAVAPGALTGGGLAAIPGLSGLATSAAGGISAFSGGVAGLVGAGAEAIGGGISGLGTAIGDTAVGQFLGFEGSGAVAAPGDVVVGGGATGGVTPEGTIAGAGDASVVQGPVAAEPSTLSQAGTALKTAATVASLASSLSNNQKIEVSESLQASPTGRRLGFGAFAEGGKFGPNAGKVLSPKQIKEATVLLKSLDELRSKIGPELAKNRLSPKDLGVDFFAEGGVVGSPTLSVVGEGGPEAIVPLRGGSIPVRLTGANRGTNSVVQTVNFNIVTPDADSFREAQPQILASTAAAIERAGRRNG